MASTRRQVVAQPSQLLVIGTLGDPRNVERALADLLVVGFTSREIGLIVPGDPPPLAAAAGDILCYDAEASTVSCRGFGTLVIIGAALPQLRALRSQVSIEELNRALVDGGLPEVDALIYELGLIRGQSLLAVRAASAERAQVAYRLLLRCGSAEVHIYRREGALGPLAARCGPGVAASGETRR